MKSENQRLLPKTCTKIFGRGLKETPDFTSNLQMVLSVFGDSMNRPTQDGMFRLVLSFLDEKDCRLEVSVLKNYHVGCVYLRLLGGTHKRCRFRSWSLRMSGATLALLQTLQYALRHAPRMCSRRLSSCISVVKNHYTDYFLAV